MIDLTNLHNPYDFANPVSDEELFVGRKEELEEIKYYLNHAKTASRPINLALLGPRASGKTSLLNMCEFEAKKRDFCTVRIDLDEGDARNQLAFFFKLFDSIFSTVCELGSFGGIEGRTYDTYLDIVNAYTIPEDKTFSPFLFPLQYAKAMGSGNINAPLSDHNYVSDLKKLRGEVNRPIILLFDECNVLANSRVHLEKLRNIFMNTPGFMLVFTGTPDLFPVMDDVFSPIIRQFKKINIRGFKEEEETQECIRKPIEKIGINPEEIFDFETYADVSEIHDLSGGRPYEIQLICHMLFRRIQNKQAKKMKLNLSVLEDVRKELETSQDMTARPILAKIRNLKKDQLSALKLLSACDGCATFDQIWTIEYIFNSSKFWTSSTLNEQVQYFIDEGILKIKDGIVKFAGDDFDKIYAKYFAREQNIYLSFRDLPLDLFVYIRLKNILGNFKELKLIPEFLGSGIDINLGSIVSKMMSTMPDEDVFVESPPIVRDLYFLMLDYREKETIPVIEIKLYLPWFNLKTWYYAKNPGDTKSLNNCLSTIDLLKQRCNEFEGNIEVSRIELRVVPVELLAQKVDQTANEQLRNILSFEHSRKMIEEYANYANVEEALFHANLLYTYNANPDPPISNNLGYVFLAVNDLSRSKILLEKAVNGYEDPHRAALPNYNLGILEAKYRNYDNALTRISLSIEQLKNSSIEQRKCDCLFIPIIMNEELSFTEIKNPDLLETAYEAKKVLERILNTSRGC